MSIRAQVALVGNPNSGKTTLFNALTGLTARTGNYPGITVESRTGTFEIENNAIDVVDLPGTYSMAPRSDDEAVAVRGVLGTLDARVRPELIVCVVDGTAIERHLYLAITLRELGVPMVLAVTMTDTLDAEGRHLDCEELSSRLGVPVFPASGVRPAEIASLKKGILRVLIEGARTKPIASPPVALPAASLDVARSLKSKLRFDADDDAVALWALSVAHAGHANVLGLDDDDARRVAALRDDGDKLSIAIAARYKKAHTFCAGIVGNAPHAPEEERTRQIDAFVLHPILGPVFFVVVFGTLFQALFSWSAPLMDLIEAGIGALGDAFAARIPDSLPLLRSLVVNGVVAGVGNVLVFVPQIAALFLFLGILDDTGYLARAAFLLDRLMARVGLHGRAFVPLLSGFACAVPALMATRTIENEKDRIVTILVTPLISCSARLPVYTLVIATLFSSSEPLFGFLEVGTVLFFAMYALGTGAAIAMAAVFKRTMLVSPVPPLVLELPPYRLPRPSQLARHVASRVWVFIREAGTVILAITIVLWALFMFPKDDALEERIARDRQVLVDGDASDDALGTFDATSAAARLEVSAAGRFGRFLEPVLSPLGFDWKISVGVIASFAAREVLVSTLGLIYGLGDGTDEESVSLRTAMANDTDPLTGKKRFTPLVGLSLMVFFVLAMQCASTLATTRRETRSWKWPVFQFTYMTALAYVASLVVFQVGTLLGFGA
jgi:ferrous iron transport protein B